MVSEITLFGRLYRRGQRSLHSLYLNRPSRLVQRELSRFAHPYKLNLGCGAVRFDGWVNMDMERASQADVVWDLAHGIPVADDSCELIYSEHMLEHLTVEQGAAFLRDCHRALRAGGVLRVAMPSLDVLLEKLCQGDWREQDWLHWPEHQFIQTRAEMVNIFFRWWGHQWIYDREELHRRLREAGFNQIEDVTHGQSPIAELRGRETRADSQLICEARK